MVPLPIRIKKKKKFKKEAHFMNISMINCENVGKTVQEVSIQKRNIKKIQAYLCLAPHCDSSKTGIIGQN